jgi:hypothetical protein
VPRGVSRTRRTRRSSPRRSSLLPGSEPQGLSNIIEEVYSAFGTLTRTTDVVRVSAQSAAPEVIVVPLAALDGRTVGFLAIGAGAEHTFTKLERALLIQIGQMTGVARARHPLSGLNTRTWLNVMEVSPESRRQTVAPQQPVRPAGPRRRPGAGQEPSMG